MGSATGLVFDGKNLVANLPTGGVIDFSTFDFKVGVFSFSYATATTTDNTATAVKTIACPPTKTVGAFAFGVATIADTSDDGLIHFAYNAVKNANGTTAVVGSTGGAVVESAAGSPVVTIVADDTADTLVVKVTGENSKTYLWHVLVISCMA